jgi:2-iminoacetate synthase ThiH
MKTAVEWLVDELQKAGYIDEKEYIMFEVIKIAKEIEREQIEKSHIDGGKNKRTAIKYYNETFKSE